MNMNYSWAQDYPEVLKICILFNLTELSSPTRFHYKSLHPLLQDGPQCGLVALAMCFKEPRAKLEVLTKEAIRRNYTINGEMFSAQRLAALASDYLLSAKIRVYTGFLDTCEIRHDLLKGKLLLVPYDTDKDNSPSQQNGKKAHWAVVSGAVETSSDFYILARHGKAKNVAVWKLSDLSASNAQLDEIGPYDRSPSLKFMVPEGGINGPLGLKCKAIIIDFIS